MSPFRRLLGYLRPYAGRLTLAGACLLLSMPAQLFHPLVWMYVVDEAIAAEEPLFHELVGGTDAAARLTLVGLAAGVMLLVQLLATAFGGLRTYLLGDVGQRFVLDLRTDLHARLLEHGLPFFHRHRSGDLLARAMGDIDTLEQVALQGTDEVVTNAVQFAGVAGVIVWLHPQVGLLTLVPMVGVAALVHGFNWRVRGLYRRVRERLGDVSERLRESLAGVLVVKAFGREAHEAQRFAEENRAYYETSLRAVLSRAIYFPGVRSVGFLSNVFMLGGGAYYIIQGSFTVGGLVAYRGYWWQLFSPVNSLARINEMMQRAVAAAGRVFELMDEEPEIRDRPGAVVLDRGRGEMRFEDVRFAHAGRERTLDGVSFEARPGDQVGIVGPSGAGKSTILALLLRLHEVDAGTVRFDGHDVRAVTQASLRRHFAVVTQEPHLFHDTIRANIRYGRPEADDAEVERAAGRANLHDFVAELADGYDTVVGERGVRLSGGQRQRIAIARAFLADPTVLLLDEPTASVEPESERIIQAALRDVLAGRTAVVVSHRVSMVRDAERILVLQDGRIAERGTHRELVDADGWYARMSRLQAGAGPERADEERSAADP